MSRSQVLHCLKWPSRASSRTRRDSRIHKRGKTLRRKNDVRERCLARRGNRVLDFFPNLRCSETSLRANSRKDARRRVSWAVKKNVGFSDTAKRAGSRSAFSSRRIMPFASFRVSDVSMINRRLAKKGDVILEKNEEQKLIEEATKMPAHS